MNQKRHNMLKPFTETELKPNRFLQLHDHDDTYFISLKNKESDEVVNLYHTTDWSIACKCFDNLVEAIRNCTKE
jgi:hypothetical protein